MTTKTKTPCISTRPTAGMGLTSLPTVHYYTPLLAQSQLVLLRDHALERENFHAAAVLAGKNGLRAALLAKHRAVRRFLETCLTERTWEVN